MRNTSLAPQSPPPRSEPSRKTEREATCNHRAQYSSARLRFHYLGSPPKIAQFLYISHLKTALDHPPADQALSASQSKQYRDSTADVLRNAPADPEVEQRHTVDHAKGSPQHPVGVLHGTGGDRATCTRATRPAASNQHSREIRTNKEALLLEQISRFVWGVKDFLLSEAHFNTRPATTRLSRENLQIE